MPGGSDIQDWFKSLPIFTRYWFALTVLFTILGRFSLLNPQWLILGWDFVINRSVSMFTACNGKEFGELQTYC